jgi:hypothetical protein
MSYILTEGLNVNGRTIKRTFVLCGVKRQQGAQERSLINLPMNEIILQHKSIFVRVK